MIKLCDVGVLLLLVVSVTTHQCVHGESVYLSLRNTNLTNNSLVVITDIGEYQGGSALVCSTTFRPCCSSASNRHGEWYYPNGTAVPNNVTGNDFYRGRGDDGTVRLSRRNNALSPLGAFYCELPVDSPSNLQTLNVTVTNTATTEVPTTEAPTIVPSATEAPTIVLSPTEAPTIVLSPTEAPTIVLSPTEAPTIVLSLTEAPTIVPFMTEAPTFIPSVTEAPTIVLSLTEAPTIVPSATEAPTIVPFTTEAPTIVPFTTEAPTIVSSTTEAPTTVAFTTEAPTTEAFMTTETTTGQQLQTTMEENFIPDPRLFQLRLSGIQNCATWTESNLIEKASEVVDAIVTNIRELCQCEFTSNQITLGGFRCFSGSIDSVTYRASIQGDASTSTEELLTHMETWINSNNSGITVQSLILKADSSCVVPISSLTEPECSQPVIGNTSTLPLEAVVGGAVLGLAVIAIIILSIVVCIVIARRRSGFKATLNVSHDRRDSGVMLSNMGAYNEAFDPTADNPERRYSELTMPRTSMQPSRDVVFTNLSCVSTDTEGYEKIDIKHVAPNGSKKSDEFTNSGYVAVEKPHSDRYSENQTQQSRLPVSFMITENPAYSELPSVRPHPSAGGPPSRNRRPQIIQEESEMDNEYSYVKIA